MLQNPRLYKLQACSCPVKHVLRAVRASLLEEPTTYRYCRGGREHVPTVIGFIEGDHSQLALFGEGPFRIFNPSDLHTFVGLTK